MQLAALLFALAPLWPIVQSTRGQALAHRISGILQSENDPVQAQELVNDIYSIHRRDNSEAPLLLNGEHSPFSSPSHSLDPSADLGSPSDLLLTTPEGSGIRSLNPASSTSLLSPATSRISRSFFHGHHRSRSDDVPMEDITFQLTPPTRPASANPSHEDLSRDEYPWLPGSPHGGVVGLDS